MKRKVIAGILIVVGLAVMSVPLYYRYTGSQKSDEMVERFEHMIEQEAGQELEHEEEKEDCGQEETEAAISEEDAATLAKEEVIGLIENLDIKYAVMEGTGNHELS